MPLTLIVILVLMASALEFAPKAARRWFVFWNAAVVCFHSSWVPELPL